MSWLLGPRGAPRSFPFFKSPDLLPPRSGGFIPLHAGEQATHFREASGETRTVIDERWKGKRCRAKREIRHHGGIIEASAEGTVQYEIDNLGRRLIQVLWDNGLSLNVFPDEIEIFESDPTAI